MRYFSWIALMLVIFTGCHGVKETTDNIGKGSANMASDIASTAKNAADSAGNITQVAGKTAIDITAGTGAVAAGAANETGKTAVGASQAMGAAAFNAASGVGTAANDVREGAIETFGVREVKTTQRIYVDKELKPIIILPAKEKPQGENARKTEI